MSLMSAMSPMPSTVAVKPKPDPDKDPLKRLGNAVGQGLNLLAPEAFVVGAKGMAGGANFISVNLANGELGYFGSRGMLHGISAVGTINLNNLLKQEAGVGYAFKVGIPGFADAVGFINVRQNGLTGAELVRALHKLEGEDTVTVSANFGVLISASDLALKALVANPATVVAATPVAVAAEASGVELLAGFGWRVSLTFKKDGTLVEANISGVKIPADQFGQVLGQLLGQAIEKERERPSITLAPNGGNRVLASFNNDLLYLSGQSPWDVAFSSIKRIRRGEHQIMEILGGTVNVLNHGNRATAVAEPVYEWGVKWGILKPGERVRDNAHAGWVIERVLDAALAQDEANKKRGQNTTHYLDALSRFMNPYDLNFGSRRLQLAYEEYRRLDSPIFRDMVNRSRKRQQLSPLPTVAPGQPLKRPEDYAWVRAVYTGEFRRPQDLERPQQPLWGAQPRRRPL